MLNTSIAVCVLGELFIVAGCALVCRVARIFFKDEGSFAFLAVAACMFIGGSNVVYLGFVSRFYSVPIVASMLFTCLGLWFWLGAKFPQVRKDSQPDAKGGISAWRLCLGSSCMALNIGCRPQFVLSCLLAIPLFWDEIVRARTLFSRASAGTTLAAVMPFVVTIGLQCAYNFARFGSPFDFGSTYNLNSFEMVSYEQKPITTLVVMFWFLLQPLHLEPYFPFVFRTSYMWPADIAASDPAGFLLYMLPVVALIAYVFAMWVRAIRHERGKTPLRRPATMAFAAFVVVFVLLFAGYARDVAALGGGMQGAIGAIGIATVEPMFGGYFWLCPMGLLVFSLPIAKGALKDRKAYVPCVLMLAFASVVLLFDARTVGANQRYFADFAWYVMLVAVLCLFAFANKRKRRKTALAFSITAVVFSFAIGACSLFSDERYDSVAELNPRLYEAVASVFPDASEHDGVASNNELIDSILKPDK